MNITMKDIAGMANVSQAAVSIAINNKQSTRVSEKKRREIIDLARKFGYVPSVSARHLRGKATNKIGILGGISGVPVQRGLIWRITNQLRNKGYHCMLADPDLNMNNKLMLNEFLAQGVDAIVILSPYDMLPESPIPCLRVDTNENDDIGIDKEYGCYELVKHLIHAHGHRNIAYLTFVPRGSRNRFSGYLKALSEVGIAPGKELFIATRNNREVEANILKLIESGKATAFCCSNDFLAAQLITFLQRNGIRIPDDVAVTGYDGLKMTELIRPAITTVIQPMFELADLIVEILMHKLGKSSKIIEQRFIKPELHLSESCGCTNKAGLTPFADFRELETIESCRKYAEEERTCGQL